MSALLRARTLPNRLHHASTTGDRAGSNAGLRRAARERERRRDVAVRHHICVPMRDVCWDFSIERETGVGSITPTIDLERGITVRMQENRDGWCEAGPVSTRDYKASYRGGGS